MGDRWWDKVASLETVEGSRECSLSAEGVLSVLQTAERLEATMYAGGLQTVLVGLPAAQLTYFKAALSEESFHNELLATLGANSTATAFYFPPGMFNDLAIFLKVAIALEDAGVMGYSAAIYQFASHLARPELALIAAQVLEVEGEHRALDRAVAQLNPPDNHCVAKVTTASVSEIAEMLRPFLAPNQFSGSSTAAVSFPDRDDVVRLATPDQCVNPGVFVV